MQEMPAVAGFGKIAPSPPSAQSVSQTDIDARITGREIVYDMGTDRSCRLSFFWTLSRLVLDVMELLGGACTVVVGARRCLVAVDGVQLGASVLDTILPGIQF